MTQWLLFAIKLDRAWLAAMAANAHIHRPSLRDLIPVGICHNCHKTIVARRDGSIYCKDECRVEDRRKKNTRYMAKRRAAEGRAPHHKRAA